MTTRCMLLLLAIAFLACGCQTTPTAGSAARDGVFVHIKAGLDQPHDAMMGLRMAQIMSADHDVLVYLDVNGIHLAMQDSPNLTLKPLGSSHAILQDLVARNVPIYACPGCLAVAGKTAEELMPGIQVAEKKAFFEFTRGRILTLDY